MKATSLIHEETDGTSIQKIQHPLFKLKKTMDAEPKGHIQNIDQEQFSIIHYWHNEI